MAETEVNRLSSMYLAGKEKEMRDRLKENDVHGSSDQMTIFHFRKYFASYCQIVILVS